jgi:hypothetical protein
VHRQLSEDCLTCISFSELRSGPERSQSGYLDRLKSLPLLKHAARAWTYHMRAAKYDQNLQARTTDFFSTQATQQFMSSVQVVNADTNFKWNVYPRYQSQLYYASSFGLETVVLYLLSSGKPLHLDAPGSRFGGTALHAATLRHHITIMVYLLEAGAKAGQGDFDGVSPLHTAASRGDHEAARILLHYGAPINANDKMNGEIPADWARMSGHWDMIELLESSGNAEKPVKELHTLVNIVSSSKSDELVVWQPGSGYFPDFYERRSGLSSSILVGLEFDGKVVFADSEHT